MEKVVNTHSLREKQNDYLYWKTKSYQERLCAIELLRQQYISFLKDVNPRLQRVCRIIDKTQG
jgi:hypothetical protein